MRTIRGSVAKRDWVPSTHLLGNSVAGLVSQHLTQRLPHSYDCLRRGTHLTNDRHPPPAHELHSLVWRGTALPRTAVCDMIDTNIGTRSDLHCNAMCCRWTMRCVADELYTVLQLLVRCAASMSGTVVCPAGSANCSPLCTQAHSWKAYVQCCCSSRRRLNR